MSPSVPKTMPVPKPPKMAPNSTASTGRGDVRTNQSPKPVKSVGSGGGGCAAFADLQWNCVDPYCSSKVNEGGSQDNYGGAEFVSRSLASAGYVPGLFPTDPQDAYQGYTYGDTTYDLTWASSEHGGGPGVEDFLWAIGWGGSASAGDIMDCAVVFPVSENPEAPDILIGVGNILVDGHAPARYHHDGNEFYIDTVYPPNN